MFKNILFDFDGVILDSMPVREYGFRKIFENHKKELVEELIVYHKQNGGLSRYNKIRYFYEKILNESISDDSVNELGEKFSIIMREELVHKKYLIKETVDFIASNYRNYILHIVSGSDGKELNFLCEKLELSKYFVSISGSPTPKVDLVKNLLANEQYCLDEYVLIGDSMNDYEAAIDNNIEFYGFNNSELKKFNYIDSFNRKDIFETI